MNAASQAQRGSDRPAGSEVWRAYEDIHPGRRRDAVAICPGATGRAEDENDLSAGQYPGVSLRGEGAHRGNEREHVPDVCGPVCGVFQTAQGVLDSIDFWTGLREVITVNPVPMPLMNEDGNVTLLQPGYDEKSKTLTFG